MRIEREDLSSSPNVITVAEAKEHLRLTHTEHDAYITALLYATEDHISEITGVMLRRHRMRFFFRPEIVFTVPFVPAFTLEKVGYYPDDGSAFTEMAAADYIVLRYGNQLQICFESLPSVIHEGMRVDVLVGYAAPIDNEKIKLGVKLLLAHLYHNMLPATDTQLWKVPWSLGMFLAGLRATKMTEVTNASSS
jgi:uncharacterized phiE125 gp8 family phage protein